VAVLTERDLRGAIRLVNEARELPRGSSVQREHVLRGIAAIVHAQVGIWGHLEDGGRLCAWLDFGWSGAAERRVLEEYCRPDSELPIDPALQLHLSAAQPSRPVLAATRDDLIRERDWYRSVHVQEVRRAARVDAFVYATWEAEGRVCGFSVHRAWGERGFGERERVLVEVIASECTFLRERAPIDSLPPRLREVLDLLSRGHSEKQVAADLDLSIHTVHDYVKTLHRRLRVQSRGELLALALRA
jgi:DNA-binding CsgD family transcriptional regulator